VAPWLIGLIEILALGAAFLVLALVRWIPSSADDECKAAGTCYCERERASGIKQPANTLSNLGFVAVGFALLAALPEAVSGSGVNPMREATAYAVIYGCVVIFLGPGSMFFHASLKRWGGWLDTLSMILYTDFLVAYDIAGIAGGGIGLFLGLWLGIAAVLGLVSAIWPSSPIGDLSTGSLCFGALALVWLALQFAVLAGGGSIQRDLGDGLLLLIAAALVFASAFMIQRKSQTGGPWCEPDTWLQGHAVWHLLTAATTVILFFYLGTELGPR
jgi:predicted membrane channel-forming protein YqfA (hemolysin III family)